MGPVWGPLFWNLGLFDSDGPRRRWRRRVAKLRNVRSCFTNWDSDWRASPERPAQKKSHPHDWPHRVGSNRLNGIDIKRGSYALRQQFLDLGLDILGVLFTATHADQLDLAFSVNDDRLGNTGHAIEIAER